MWEMAALSQTEAEGLLEKLRNVECYFVGVRTAPALGAFTNLHTTMRLRNEEIRSFSEMWDIDTATLMGDAGSAARKRAVNHLAHVFGTGVQKLRELSEELESNGRVEHKHMVTIAEYLLKPLMGGGETSVVLNKVEYSSVPGVKTDFLGMGNEHTWHGAPDCRADIVDVINLDTVPQEEEVSDAESQGRKTPVEVKPVTLMVRHLHQIVGNAVVYSFTHHNRHPDQNSLVPVLGISGLRGLMMVTLYDCVEDVLVYVHPHKWFNTYEVLFAPEGLLMVWLALYHSLFLKRLRGVYVKSGLHERFSRDNLLAHYKHLSRIDVNYWPGIQFDTFATRKRNREESGSSDTST